MKAPYFTKSPIEGVTVFCPRVVVDERGIFVKSFHEGIFAGQGIEFATREEFYSTSIRNVLRGMHFQTPPAQHAKIVTCIAGKILDVVLDLRKDSPTFGKTWSVEVSGENHLVIYIPEGIAHGFCTLSEEALVHYKTSTVHNPDQDRGVRWNSFGFSWPVAKPILSPRDESFPALADFISPF